MSKLRQSARGQECQIRIAGVCCGDSSTVVLCHFRMVGMSGLGIKSPDWLGAFGCFKCHQFVDSHGDPGTQLDFAHGVFRTIAKQIESGLIKA